MVAGRLGRNRLQHGEELRPPAEAPGVVAVDDVHWADAPSLRAIAHLVRRLEGLPILVVLAVRALRSGADDALLAGLAADPRAVVLRPAALGDEACDELVRRELASDVAPGFRAACRELTGGNPFLLESLLASLAADGIGEHLRRMTPAAVSRSVLLQLGRMPADARAVARAVAVLGTSATTARAARLAGLEDEDAAAAIAALMAEHVVEAGRELRYGKLGISSRRELPAALSVD
jgi:predicted ATPase